MLGRNNDIKPVAGQRGRHHHHYRAPQLALGQQHGQVSTMPDPDNKIRSLRLGKEASTEQVAQQVMPRPRLYRNIEAR